MDDKKAYCVKCKKMVNIRNPKRQKIGDRRFSLIGTCENCKTKVSRFI